VTVALGAPRRKAALPHPRQFWSRQRPGQLRKLDFPFLKGALNIERLILRGGLGRFLDDLYDVQGMFHA
jgi:hypothetical protein